jgi:hypothetical protein
VDSGVSIKMLEGGKVKQIFELKGQGRSIWGIADDLGLSKNTVKKYLRCPGLPKPRPHRPSPLDPFKERLQTRLAEGVFNCEVLKRELVALGYRVRLVWGFVMVLSWSRAIYVEFIRRADVGSFIRCHLNAFRAFGGIPLRCLYDNTKLVVHDRDEAVWVATTADVRDHGTTRAQRRPDGGAGRFRPVRQKLVRPVHPVGGPDPDALRQLPGRPPLRGSHGQEGEGHPHGSDDRQGGLSRPQRYLRGTTRPLQARLQVQA